MSSPTIGAKCPKLSLRLILLYLVLVQKGRKPKRPIPKDRTKKATNLKGRKPKKTYI